MPHNATIKRASDNPCRFENNSDAGVTQKDFRAIMRLQASAFKCAAAERSLDQSCHTASQSVPAPVQHQHLVKSCNSKQGFV